MSQPYEILTGVGTLYLAASGTAKPALSSAPGASWRDVGETDGGVKITKTRKREAFSSDQRTGKVKVVQTEEGLTIETNLQEITLENLADVINSTVTSVAAGVGTIGTKSVTLHSGAEVTEFAVVFRGKSAYGNFPAQYYIPRVYMDDDTEMEHTKDGKTLIPVKFEALEYDAASSEAERFGVFEMQTAAAS